MYLDLEKELILGNLALSEEEKEFLRRLTEEPTSVSADLTPQKSSFITSGMSQAPSALTPISKSDLAPQSSKRN